MRIGARACACLLVLAVLLIGFASAESIGEACEACASGTDTLVAHAAVQYLKSDGTPIPTDELCQNRIYALNLTPASCRVTGGCHGSPVDYDYYHNTRILVRDGASSLLDVTINSPATSSIMPASVPGVASSNYTIRVLLEPLTPFGPGLPVLSCALSSVSVSPNVNSISAGGAQVFSAYGIDDRGNVYPVTASWSVAGGIGTLSTAVGASTTLTATKAGTGYVVASFGGLSGNSTVTVSPGNAVWLEVVPNPASVSVVGTQVFGAIGRDAYGNEAQLAPAPVWWTDGGSITNEGVFTAQGTPAAGRVVRATSGALSNSSSVDITALPATGVTLYSPMAPGLTRCGVANVEACLSTDVVAQWGAIFRDESNNVVHDGCSVCVGQNLTLIPLESADWGPYNGGYVQTPPVQFVNRTVFSGLLAVFDPIAGFPWCAQPRNFPCSEITEWDVGQKANVSVLTCDDLESAGALPPNCFFTGGTNPPPFGTDYCECEVYAAIAANGTVTTYLGANPIAASDVMSATPRVQIPNTPGSYTLRPDLTIDMLGYIRGSRAVILKSKTPASNLPRTLAGNSITVNVVEKENGPVLALTSASLSPSAVYVGEPVSIFATLLNTGDVEARITSVSLNPSFSFSVVQNGVGTKLAPGATAEMILKAYPSPMGAYTATLTIGYNSTRPVACAVGDPYLSGSVAGLVGDIDVIAKSACNETVDIRANLTNCDVWDAGTSTCTINTLKNFAGKNVRFNDSSGNLVISTTGNLSAGGASGQSGCDIIITARSLAVEKGGVMSANGGSGIDSGMRGGDGGNIRITVKELRAAGLIEASGAAGYSAPPGGREGGGGGRGGNIDISVTTCDQWLGDGWARADGGLGGNGDGSGSSPGSSGRGVCGEGGACSCPCGGLWGSGGYGGGGGACGGANEAGGGGGGSGGIIRVNANISSFAINFSARGGDGGGNVFAGGTGGNETVVTSVACYPATKSSNFGKNGTAGAGRTGGGGGGGGAVVVGPCSTVPRCWLSAESLPQTPPPGGANSTITVTYENFQPNPQANVSCGTSAPQIKSCTGIDSIPGTGACRVNCTYSASTTYVITGRVNASSAWVECKPASVLVGCSPYV
ncbi:MAG: hypothetical protein AB1468_00435 [Candidatus Micrarchaeota archaeon]